MTGYLLVREKDNNQPGNLSSEHRLPAQTSVYTALANKAAEDISAPKVCPLAIAEVSQAPLISYDNYARHQDIGRFVPLCYRR